jgi:hypothetical protein
MTQNVSRLVLVACVLAAGNATAAAAFTIPVINSATYDATTQVLTLSGENLIEGRRAPTLEFNDALLTVTTATATQVTAPLSNATPPGSYRVVLHRSAFEEHSNRRKGKEHSDRDEFEERWDVAMFDVTIGSVGAHGPPGIQGSMGFQGPQGPAGPQGGIGPQGSAGAAGAAGVAGPAGAGATVSDVVAGGACGPLAGAKMTDGANNSSIVCDGKPGATGPVGPAGPAGSGSGGGISAWSALADGVTLGLSPAVVLQKTVAGATGYVASASLWVNNHLWTVCNLLATSNGVTVPIDRKMMRTSTAYSNGAMHLQGVFQPSDTGAVSFMVTCLDTGSSSTAESLSLIVMAVGLQP